jgi:hypothetical protein
MKSEKEFGYTVSKDYEKLWKLIKSGSKVAGRIDFERGLNGNQIRDIVEIKYILEEYYIGTRGISYTGMNGTKDEFIGICKSLNVTFIDPNPPNPNAIFYADGGEVEVGDKFRYIGHGGGIGVQEGEIILQHGSLGYYIRKIPPRHFSSFAGRVSIKWDGNRMTNVEKVEK